MKRNWPSQAQGQRNIDERKRIIILENGMDAIEYMQIQNVLCGELPLIVSISGLIKAEEVGDEAKEEKRGCRNQVISGRPK